MVTHRRAEACSQPAAASLKRDVWGEPRRLLVGFDEPNGAVVKVAEKLLIVWRTRFRFPDDLASEEQELAAGVYNAERLAAKMEIPVQSFNWSAWPIWRLAALWGPASGAHASE